MNKRIMVLLLALVAVLFISVAPVEVNAAADAHTCFDDNGNCVCDYPGCTEPMHVPNQQWTSDETGHYQWCYRNDNTKLLEADHTYGKFVNQGAHQHWRTCTVCAYVDRQYHADANADCICDDCGAQLEHELVLDRGFDATCEKDGIKWHYECDNCGGFFWDEAAQSATTASAVVIPALKHEPGTAWDYDDAQHYHWCWRDDNTKMDVANHTFRYVNQGRDMHDVICDTCGYSERVPHAEGYIADCKCDDCGAELEHTLRLVPYQPATCLEDGHEAYEYCLNCGELFDYEVIAARGYHEMGSYVYQDVREGDHYTMCNYCDYRMHEPHTMVLGDPLKGNYHQWLCECGKLDVETHYNKNGDNKCDVCGHDMGGTSVKVENHDSTTVKTGQKDTVKPNKSWWQNWQDVLKPSNSGGSTTTEQTVAPPTNSGASNSSNANVGSNTTTGGNANVGSNTTTGGNANVGNNTTIGGNTTTGSNASNNGGSNVGAPAVSAPSASQTNVLAQFINWFLGLFGF